MKKLFWIICVVIAVMAYMGIVGLLRDAKAWLWGESDDTDTDCDDSFVESTETEEALMIFEESDEVFVGDEW